MTLLAVPWRRLMSMIWPGKDLEASATVSNLLRLPPEIIMSIASILPAESSASLALSCRQLSHILGGKSWKSLRHMMLGSHFCPPWRKTFLNSFHAGSVCDFIALAQSNCLEICHTLETLRAPLGGPGLSIAIYIILHMR